MFGINKRTFYKIKNEQLLIGGSKYNYLKKSIRRTKINNQVKTYIKSYVTSNINFDYKKLIMLVNKNYNIVISKSTIYNILKDDKIKKKNNS